MSSQIDTPLALVMMKSPQGGISVTLGELIWKVK
jgi:hypothetical protein